MATSVLWIIAIFLSRVADMSMATIRTILLVRGMKLPAAIIGFFEILIFVLVLGKVMSSLDSPTNILAYCLGFAFGNYTGAWLEGKFAIGNVLVQVISIEHAETITEEARAAGLAVTVVRGEGRSGKRKILNIHMKRKLLPKVLRRLHEIDPIAYVSIFDSRQAVGGFFGAGKGMKKA